MNITYYNFKSTIKLNATQEYYTRLRALLKIKKVVGKNFIRLGAHNDGGYVMLDNFHASGGCYCLFVRHL